MHSSKPLTNPATPKGLTIVIYFDDPALLGYPINLTMYFQSYKWFSEYCAKHDAEVIIARGDSYLGTMQFRDGYRFGPLTIEKVEGPITASVILRKGLNLYGKTAPDDLIMNTEEFDQFAGNKWEMYEELTEFMAPTHPLRMEDWENTITKITTSRVVLKPVHGTGGTGIIISDTGNLNLENVTFDEPYLIQNFVDTSKGIPGIVDTVHDLRFVIFSGHVGEWAYLRIPKSGSLLSNISKGASAKPVKVDQLPQFILDTVAKIDKKLERFPHRFYSADFLVEGNKAILGEINPQPGFPHLYNEGQEFCDMFYKNLHALLEKTQAQHKKTAA